MPTAPILQRGHASPRGSSARRSRGSSSCAPFNGATRHRVDRVLRPVTALRCPHHPSTGPRVTAWIESTSARCSRGCGRPSTGPRVTAWIEPAAVWMSPRRASGPPFNGATRHRVDRAKRSHRRRPNRPPFNGATRHRVDRGRRRRAHRRALGPFNGATRHRVDRAARRVEAFGATRNPSTGPRVTTWIELLALPALDTTRRNLQRGHASPRGSRRPLECARGSCMCSFNGATRHRVDRVRRP